MSVTKKDIADLLVEKIGVTHNQALSITNDFFDACLVLVTLLSERSQPDQVETLRQASKS